MRNDDVKKRKKIINMFFEDLAVLLIAAPVGIVICHFIVMQKYALKWFWTVLIALVAWYALISTTKRFKLWRLCRKDLKEHKITKKEIVIEELKHEHSSHSVHRTTPNFLEDLITDVLLGWTEDVIKTRGGEDCYTLTDTDNDTYHLMNFYKTKMRKKDIKGKFYFSELKGGAIEIEYLENSKIILSVKMNKSDKNSKLVGGFGEVFGGYMI